MPSDELTTLLTGHLKASVPRGRYSWSTIVDDCVEYLHGQGDPAELRALAAPLVSDAFAAHRAEQATWPERTDNDRLTDAFRALNLAGIVAREDFACCQNCGLGEIGSEVAGDEPPRAYAFYHQQDAEGAAEGGDLWIAYGLFEQPPTVEIGAEVAAALRAEGLEADWDGSAGERVRVRLRWARWRHGRMAAYPSGPGRSEIGVEVVRGTHEPAPTYPDTVLAETELPWLPAGVALRLTEGDREVVLHREFDRLVADDGRHAGRFQGLSLLRGETRTAEPETGLLETSYESLPAGPAEPLSRPMTLPEAIDVLRRLPPRTGSWMCARGRSGVVVQMRWEQDRLWLETPDVASQASIGKFALMAEAERMLAVLADEDRVAIGELPGVVTKPW